MTRIMLACAACLMMAGAFNVRAHAQQCTVQTVGKVFGCAINGKPGQKTCLEPGVFSPCRPTVQPPPPGTLTILHRFNLNTDGDQVRGSLVFNPRTGRLYGVAGEGGQHANHTTGQPCDSEDNWKTAVHWFQCPGTLFSMNTDGSDFRVEHAFSQSNSVGHLGGGIEHRRIPPLGFARRDLRRCAARRDMVGRGPGSRCSIQFRPEHRPLGLQGGP